MHVKDSAVELTMFLSLACCVLSFPAHLLRVQEFKLSASVPLLYCMASLHGKDKIIVPAIILMFIIITSFIWKLPFLQMPLRHSAVWIPHCSRADRAVTASARVHRPAVFVHTQKGPALLASGC